MGEIGFGWDNEFPAQIVQVPDFRIDRIPVTVARFLPFVKAGGYTDPRWWDADDFAWLSEQRRDHPLRWRRDGGGWSVRDVFRWLPLDAVSGWPVQVSRAEALAFCRWSGTRLPTEAELHRAAFTHPDGIRIDPCPGGIGARHRGRGPSTSRSTARSRPDRRRLRRARGGWRSWWATAGSGATRRSCRGRGSRRIHASYPGYSADFFDGQHWVVFGGSWATAAGLVRRSFRNWYQGRYPYVFSKFRTVAP